MSATKRAHAHNVIAYRALAGVFRRSRPAIAIVDGLRQCRADTLVRHSTAQPAIGEGCA